MELLTKGRLPHTLHWFFRVAESHLPHGFSIEAWGDFEGRGAGTFHLSLTHTDGVAIAFVVAEQAPCAPS